MIKKRLSLWLIVLLTLCALFVNLPQLPKFELFGRQLNLANFPLKLGLDLQGGVQLILDTQMDKIDPSSRDDALESVREVIERRVNLFGVSEAVVQSSKLGERRRILVEIPGINDASAAAQLLGTTAQLDFRLIKEDLTGASQEAYLTALFGAEPTGLNGSDLKKAQVVYSSAANQQSQSGPMVEIQFTDEGAKKFADITRVNVGKQLAIYLDEQPISAPTIQQEIIGGTAVITGQSDVEEAKNLSIQLNAGALPVPVKVLEQRQIGPTLGQESVDKSIKAGVVGLIVIGVYMILFYGLWGVVAVIALLIYTILTLAIFRTGLFMPQLQVTLTLAGIAGFILSVGMAVDANILIFERMKEEIRWGRSKKLALELGFKRAWSSIWASNVSSLITAAILFYMGTSVVKGFAVTLAIGVLVSMFSAIIVSRTLLRLIVR